MRAQATAANAAGAAAAPAATPRVLSSTDHRPPGFKWIALRQVRWRDAAGAERVWESAERTTRPSSGVDAVCIVAKVRSAAAPPRVVLIQQYRPPLDAYVLEMPAGLIDEGETAAEAGVRELREETGYSAAGGAAAVRVTPPCFSDPGMSSANMIWAFVEIDADAPENAAPVAEPHEGECISVALAPWDGLLRWLLEARERDGCEVDARLLAFALGLDAAGGGAPA